MLHVLFRIQSPIEFLLNLTIAKENINYYYYIFPEVDKFTKVIFKLLVKHSDTIKLICKTVYSYNSITAIQSLFTGSYS